MDQGKDLRRADFGFGRVIPTRWGDVDSYGHVNNVVYYAWFDTVIGQMLIERGMIWPHAGDLIGLCVASGCEFYAPVHFPQAVEARLRIARAGTTSLRYEIGLFLEGRDEPAAAGFFVHAFVHQSTRRPQPLSEAQHRAVADLCHP